MEGHAAGHVKCIFVFSGKRKSGKDYITDIIKKSLGEANCAIIRLSGPLKKQYAKEHNLDFDRLLDASEYKEIYRVDMIQWGEDKRNQDPGFFCRLATSGEEANRPVWIISDARRLTDIAYFKDNYGSKVHLIRVEADEETRIQRGFTFTPGVDDVESECGLDSGVEWDFIIDNGREGSKLQYSLEPVLSLALTALKDASS